MFAQLNNGRLININHIASLSPWYKYSATYAVHGKEGEAELVWSSGNNWHISNKQDYDTIKELIEAHNGIRQFPKDSAA